MKKLLLIFVITSLFACQDASKKDAKPNEGTVKNTKTEKETFKDPVPQTITQTEVTRIALVEALQFINNAKDKGFDVDSIKQEYEKASLAHKSGSHKEAQKMAVEIRHKVEKLLLTKK